MKKITLFLSFLFATSFCLNAQLVNNGGTITIQANASLIVEGDVDQSSGTIVNNGTLSFTGDMTNSGIYTAGAASKLIATGTSASSLDMNGATVAILENAKTSGDVTLGSSVEVSEAVDFSGTSDIILSDYNLILEEAATTNGSTTGHFVTDGIGTLNKEVSASGTYTADVGDGTVYSPIEYVHSGTYNNSTINTSVTNMKHPDVTGAVADADDFLNRYWETTSSITNPSIAMTGTYDAGDVTGTAADMVGARWENTTWEFAGGAQSGSTVSATTTAATSELTGLNFFGKINTKTFLEGAYSGGSMTQNLTLPLSSPYTDAPLTVTAVPANAVDWVKLEVRDPNDASTILKAVSAFILTDGSIVDENGNQVLAKDVEETGYVAVFHRNHLPMRSANTFSMTDGTLYDFSTALSQAYDAGLANDAMVDLGSSVFGLYKSNVNSDLSINIVDFFQAKLNTSPTQSGVYSDFDVNMDGNVNIVDFFQAKLATSPTKNAHL